MKRNQYCLGIDTSNYTTSAAIVDDKGVLVADTRRVLAVRKGERGLRQSQALFEHIANLPAVFAELFRQAEESETFSREQVCCVSVSVQPRPVEGSYMPVFRAGIAAAFAVAESLGVPCYGFSHQEGHIAAVLPGSGLPEEEAFLALHLSGGTTEVLQCRKREALSGPAFDLSLAGETRDLSYGQVIDRAGVALGLPFPCGKEMDRAAIEEKRRGVVMPNRFCRIHTEAGRLNLSGIETQVSRFIQKELKQGTEASALVGPVSASLLYRIGESLQTLICQCREQTGLGPVLLGGGVAASEFLRDMLGNDPAIFWGEPTLSSDNAVGTARLGMQRWLTGVPGESPLL